MKRKIISMLMTMTILLITVDVSVFASETTMSGKEAQNVVEEESSCGESEEVCSDVASVSKDEIERNNSAFMSINQKETEKIEIGDYITLGTYYGEKILWRCVDIDENGPLMLSDRILTFKPFDASGANGGSSHERGNTNNHKRRERGSAYWADSNIRDWLNSTAEEVEYSCGNPPTNDKVYCGYNDYADESGFLSKDNFTEEEVAMIKTVTQKFVLNKVDIALADGGSEGHSEGFGINDFLLNYDTAYYKNTTDKIFLLNLEQLKVVYDTFGDYYRAYPTQEAINNSERKIGNSAAKYWLRDSIYNDYVSTHARIVGSEDAKAGRELDFIWGYDDKGVGIRPACYLDVEKFEIYSGEGTEDNPIVLENATEIDETIINTVERYTSDKEVQEILDIFNNSSSDEEIRQRLFEYYNYDNMLDVRERIIELSDMHDERWDYEGLIRDDMYLSWQYYDYLNNTSKGAAARVSLYASGLVFNGEINEWIDPTTYIDSELPGIKKYKSLLEEFIQKQSSSIELYTYMSEAEKFINSTVGVWSKTEKAEVIKKLKEAPDSVTCESIFNDFVANKISYGEKTMTYVYDADEKPMFMEAMGITDTVFSVMNVTMDGIAGIVDISSNLETYQVYHSFLQEIYEADDLPWELVVAAYQLDQELEQAYWTPIQGILNEIRDECLDEAFDAAGFENLLNKNGWLSAINYTAFCINQFVDVGAMVVNSCHTEGYAFLAMHYKNKLEECKKQFLANKTEENAYAFYEAYVMLWKLRIAGEEKFLQMSNLEGGKVVDGLSEAATGGTIAGLISDLCGYADKEAAINDNLKMLAGFSFKYSIKDEDLPDEYKYLQKVVIECPVSVEILTADGTKVCILNDGIETEITNEYGTFISFYRATTGDYAKIAYFNDDAKYSIRAIGQASGNVTYSSAKTEDHLTYTIEGFDNVIISENDIIHITTDDEKYTIDKEGDGTTDIEGEQADKNKTFVQFDYQDGKQIQVKYVNENGMVTMPETPVREGYEFKGWFTEPEGLGEEFTTATVINRSMTVYAKWESKETLPTVTANIETGSVVEKTTEIILSCEIEEAQIYYTLDETNPTADSTLYTEPIVLTEATTIKAIAVKEGYNNSEVAVFTYTIAEGETVTFTVTFNSNGGSEVSTQFVEENQKAKEPKKTTRKGYLLKGWYLGDKLYDFETPVTTDIILEARWEIDESQKKGDVLPEDIPSDGIIPAGIWSAGVADKTYTAGAIKQSFRVYDGTKLLREKVDYTISYKNNKNVYSYLDEDYIAFEENLKNTGRKVKTGTFDPAKAPQVTIKMKGNYLGSKTIYFKIEPADISADEFEIADLTVTYTGKKQTPQPTLTWNGKKLKYGTDFYIPEYDNAKNDKKAFTEPQGEPYKLTVTGKKNFAGEIPITLTISNGKKQIAMSKVTVKGITNQKWNGEQITQSGFKVSYGKDVLTEENGDYTISWGANKEVGKGTVTFTGTGQDTDGDGFSYIGTKTVTFKITGITMSKVSVSGVEKSYPFTGTAIEPVASLSYKANKNADSVPLTEGTHYTVDYQRNVDKGTATIIFKGLESCGYTGTKKCTFKITAAGISDLTDGNVATEQIKITFKDAENVQDGVYIAPHMKGGAKPEVIVTSGGMTLEPNKDYSISYSNNKKPALSTDKNAPSLTVKGKGNFTGSKKIYFTIAPKALTNENRINVVVNDKIVSNKQNGYRQNFKVYDSDGKVLGSADYDAGKAVYTLIETQNEDGTVKQENRILDKKSTVPANSTIRITIPGKGNYAGGETYATYRILENSHDISKATILIQNQNYSGNPVLITEQSQFKTGEVYIKIGKETRELILGKDIQVVPESYVNNVNKGTAKVTFRGINDFGGIKTVSYKIGVRSVEEFWKDIQDRMVKIFDLKMLFESLEEHPKNCVYL